MRTHTQWERSTVRRTIGVLLIIHGVAHALAGMQVYAGATSWLLQLLGASDDQIRLAGWLCWTIAMPALVGAGFGWLGVSHFRAYARTLTLVGAISSLLLLATFWTVTWSAPGMAIDIMLLAGYALGIGRYVTPTRAARRAPRRIAEAVAVAAVAWLVIVAATMPWRNRWGSTDAELRASLPGDDVFTGTPTYWVQHAVTIRAPARQVWPWLAQLGTDRGGFYSYSSLENLFGIRVRNADRIHPEWQNARTGGFVVAAPAGYLGIDHPLGWRISLAQAPRVLVLEKWGAFVLTPLDSMTTRFIVRTRNRQPVTLPGVAFASLGLVFFEPAHFIMQRAMLLGVKHRAEQHVTLDVPPIAGGAP